MVTKDNTILITGGGAGIGLALVRELYYEGNNIIVTGRKEETLNAVKNEFPNISTLQCDLMNPRDVNNLLDTCKKAFKPINVFISCIQRCRPIKLRFFVTNFLSIKSDLIRITYHLHLINET